MMTVPSHLDIVSNSGYVICHYWEQDWCSHRELVRYKCHRAEQGEGGALSSHHEEKCNAMCFFIF
jgi:hypothetical protein